MRCRFRPSAAALAGGALLALLAAPAPAAQVEGRVLEIDREAGTFTVETEGGEQVTVARALSTRFEDGTTWRGLAPGDRVTVETRRPEPAEGEAEAGRTHRADLADAREPKALDELSREGGKPYDRLGLAGADVPQWEAVRIARAEEPAPVSAPPPAGRTPEPNGEPPPRDRAPAAAPVETLPDTASERPLLLVGGALALAGGLALRYSRRADRRRSE